MRHTVSSIPALSAPLRQQAADWYAGRDWTPFPFQEEMLARYLGGESGLLNAPTGSGKTYALWIPILLDWLRQPQRPTGLQVLWVTPLRALAKDICAACAEACSELEVPWRVEIRTGDISSQQRSQQLRRLPEALIITPESLHVLLAQARHPDIFAQLSAVVVDEWHELLGNKRGVQVELALARLRQLRPGLRTWGISATIGNLPEAHDVLMGPASADQPPVIVQAQHRKTLEIHSLLPATIETYPWAGHLGLDMIGQVLPIIAQSESTLVFCNTRAQCERWYQQLLEAEPDLAGRMAMHHGSLDQEVRAWVEEALHAGQLQVVVCTSSLDLGVDFRPVDTVVQIGSPKGVARFLQRAGRSGHRPGAASRIYFAPAHALELVEGAALKQAVAAGIVEARRPVERAYDVLAQYLLTLAVGVGLWPDAAYAEVRTTWAYRHLERAEFDWIIRFLQTGGPALQAYETYHKLRQDEDGSLRLDDKRLARQHRLSIGTIVSDSNLVVKYVRGGRLGTVEESFASQLQPGDVFWFGGKSLELVRIRGMEVQVKRSRKKTGKVPRWMGSRMLLSSQLATLLRQQFDAYLQGQATGPEMTHLQPLLAVQARYSAIPRQDECLIEYIESREGHHLFVYPFEGRVVHEMLGALLAWRIARLSPLSFSIAMNDYGLELLCDQPIPLDEALEAGWFAPEGLEADLAHSLNQTEMAVRRFREVARVAGLIFQGFPGQGVSNKHLQASTSLLYQVFRDYDPDNLLLRQAQREVIDYQIDAHRLRAALARLQGQQLRVTRPGRFTPFSFPIMVDRLRERLSTEKLADRIARMQVQLEGG